MAAGIVMTNNGLEWVAERIAGTQGSGTNAVSTNAGTHIGWGTGTTTPAAADTALQTAASEARAATTVTVTGSGATAKYQATGAAITSASAQAITEAGLFSASTSGIMFIHAVFGALSLAIGDSVIFVATIAPS